MQSTDPQGGESSRQRATGIQAPRISAIHTEPSLRSPIEPREPSTRATLEELDEDVSDLGFDLDSLPSTVSKAGKPYKSEVDSRRLLGYKDHVKGVAREESRAAVATAPLRGSPHCKLLEPSFEEAVSGLLDDGLDNLLLAFKGRDRYIALHRIALHHIASHYITLCHAEGGEGGMRHDRKRDQGRGSDRDRGRDRGVT
ncbi:hypothetical protein MBM_08284 [Drepanopeziza brunnea f. sp. 'multigermtubi' MB_m1]|uniref:Uncharacterized protein n=1 Tax=Marssonina brunnea f. sp. multigermtubi (strain MB_m1) TaxID=1072389 RepID=K1WL53_MARBU|nr:uncharacterized protein MBM_08284 [Drepanopeziza brunnea f. sp. 'multigermtubi' MB_m1]EKD13566.1 hypothetical protein MBM_08284 [Drepanopeziza brunnea f. sp. 'multigermtubi' MB_m1]